MASKEESSSIHLSSQMTASAQWDRINLSYKYEGDYKEIEGVLSKEDYAVGMPFGNFFGAECPFEESRITAVSAGRTSGNRGYLQIDVVSLTKKYMAQLSMNEVSKNIRTWKADAAEDEKPKLDKLAEWEMWKDKGDQASLSKYNAYLDARGVKLSGNTLKLAEMIYRGVQEYAVYQPNISVTFTGYEVFSEYGKDMGKKVEKGSFTPEKYTILGPSGASFSEYEALATYFIKTGLSSSLNPDGTYTFTMNYLGVESYEKDIYDKQPQDENT